MGTETGELRKPGIRTFYPLAWRAGGPVERFLLAFTVFTLCFLIALVAPLYWMIWNRAWPPEVGLSYALAVMSLSLYNPAIEDVLYGMEFRRQALARGLFSGYSEYLSELNRYVEAFGHGGRLPNDALWAALGWFTYYAMIGVSFGLTLFTYRVVGPAALLVFFLVNASVALGFFFLHARRTWRVLRAASDRGYDLLRLRPRGRGVRLSLPPGGSKGGA